MFILNQLSLVFILLLLLISSCATTATTFQQDENSNNKCGILNVLDFGAKGDGETLDTSAIQHTFDAALNKMGCIILFPSKHVYLTGPFNITSTGNIEIQIEQDATIQFQQNDLYIQKFSIHMLQINYVINPCFFVNSIAPM